MTLTIKLSMCNCSHRGDSKRKKHDHRENRKKHFFTHEIFLLMKDLNILEISRNLEKIWRATSF
jgi:hypothetical protein